MDRRSLLLALAAGAASAGRVYAQAEGGRDLRSFGARGDGVSDDTEALMQALDSGLPIDGGGRSYGVRGALEAGSRFKGLFRCTLRQLEANDHLQTLSIRGAGGFRLADVQVLRGPQNDDALIQRDMQRNAGIWIQDSSGFRLERVGVSGGGIGTGLVVMQCQSFSVVDCTANGIHYRLRERPKDDMLQGIWLNRCMGFDLTRPKVWDLGGHDDQGFSRDNNRAICLSGSSNYKIVDLDVSQCGQGLDVTGREGDHDVEIIGGHAADCFSWGFKFANSAFRVHLSGALAERCGLGGFTASGASEAGDPPEQDIDIVDCRAIDCGAQGTPHTTFGFGIGHGKVDWGHPIRVRFVRCTAIDNRSPPGMKWGFWNEIPVTGADRNIVEQCVVKGAAVTDFKGFGS